MSEQVISAPINNRSGLTPTLSVRTTFDDDVNSNLKKEGEECYTSPGSDEEFWESMLRSPTLIIYSDSESDDEDETDEEEVVRKKGKRRMSEPTNDELDQVLSKINISSGSRHRSKRIQNKWTNDLRILQDITQHKMEKLLQFTGEAPLHRRLQLSLFWDQINTKMPSPGYTSSGFFEGSSVNLVE